jgi:hypothetical protein
MEHRPAVHGAKRRAAGRFHQWRTEYQLPDPNGVFPASAAWCWASTFGVVTGAANNPRQMELGLRLHF